jgi:hypothetical protein
MKNIHILPTDKPSRLAGSEYITNEQGIDKRVFKFKLWDKLIPNKDLKDIGYIPQNIYITSDEEIKDVRPHKGKWQLEKGQILNKFPNYLTDLSECKLVIMTTDPDLIAEGVQAIDNDFLEWFVKNPSCEQVEVVKGKMQLNDDGQEYGFPDMSLYKIIIPQEEPKQREVFLMNANEVIDTRKSKQEPLEDFIRRESKSGNESVGILKDVIWQAERMYSEEDLKLILQLFVKDTRGNSPWVDADDEWFEQNKRR